MNKITILIVEDEAIIAENLRSKLEQLGYEVSGMATKSEEAVHIALRLKPQLILMDIQLNGQEDGIQAAKTIRAQYDVPVIYLTAHSDPATLSRAKLTGPFGYILKPFEMRDLVTQIELAIYKHKADQLVREQREWLRVTLTSIGDAVIATDATGLITFVNPVAVQLTGWKADEAVNQPLSKVFRIVNERTGKPVENPVACVLRECRTVPLANQTAIISKDGHTVPIEDTAAPILDAAGNVIGVVLVFQDVTEKRRVQDALRTSEERYRQLLAVLPTAMYTCDAKGVITYFNAQAAEIWGRTPCIGDTDERFCGSFRLFRPDGTYLPHNETPMAVVLHQGNRVRGEEVIIERPDHSRVWVSVNIDPLLDNENEIRGAINVFIDITQRKQAEEALSYQRELLQNIFDNIPVMLVMWDASLKRFTLNRHAETVLGWTTADANEDDFISKVYPDADYRARVSAYMQSLQPGWREWGVTTKSGDNVPSNWANIQLSNNTMIGIGVDLRDRKKAEEALREREERLHLFIEHAPVALAMFDKEMRYLSASRRWLKDYGLEGKEVIGLSHYQIFPEIPERWKEVHRRGLSGEIVEAEEDAFTRLNGAVQWLRWVVRPWHTSAGAIGGIVIFTEDITYRKEAQEVLQRYEILAKNSRDIILFMDQQNGRILEGNAAATQAYGYSREEMLKLTIQDLRALDTQSLTAGQMEIASSQGILFDTVHQRKDGSLFPVEVSSQGAYNGGRQTLISVIRDITERKEAEAYQKRIKERQALLAQVAERLLRAENPQVVVEDLCRLVMAHLDCQFFFNYLVEEPGKVMHLNACAGIPKESADKIRRLDFGVAVCGCVAQECQRIIAEDIQNSEDVRTQLVKSFGVQAYCCHPLLAQDRLIGTLSFGTKTRPTFSDDEVALMKSVCDQVAVAMQRLIAEQELHQVNVFLEQQVAERTRQAETRSKQLQALAVELIEAEERERRRLADHLHDDLQQMLAAARMQLDLARHIPDESTLSNVSQLLEESIAKARRLSHELSPPVLQHADLVAALQWIARYYNEQFGLHVEIVADEAQRTESGPIKVFLFRAVQELLFNVVKHANAKNARIDLAMTDGCLVLTVSDQGRGIKPDILESGSAPAGLGLLSLRERAQYIGGSLVIESEPGLGSRFTLKVPYTNLKADDLLRPMALQPAETAAERASAFIPDVTRVLFVDDHKVMRQGLINLLGTQPGIHVAGEASNGKEAIDRVRQLKPDVVVMDVSMPEMDGIEATRHIKKQWPEVRVIGLSMIENSHLTRNMLKAGAEAFVSKTASSAELLKAIFGITR